MSLRSIFQFFFTVIVFLIELNNFHMHVLFWILEENTLFPIVVDDDPTYLYNLSLKTIDITDSIITSVTISG